MPSTPAAPFPSNLLAIRSGRRSARSHSLAWVAIRCPPGHAPPNWAAIDLAGEVLGDRPAWATGTKWDREGGGEGGPAGVLSVRRRTRRGVVVVRRD